LTCEFAGFFEGLLEALSLHMAGMIEDGEVLPEPSTLDALARKAGMTRSAYMVQSAVRGVESARAGRR